jgi:DNA topoisomerase-1
MSEYWIGKQFAGVKYKWTTLEHNGVLFPPKYIKHNVPVIYNGEPIILDELAEEYATIFAKYTDTEYIKNKIFTRNFWKDWSKILGKNHTIQDLELCDFSKIYQHIIDEKERTKEERAAMKAEAEKTEEKYKYAIVDGVKQPVGNYRIEPPGLFIGRGCHPKMGSIKPRIKPEDIIINIGKDATIPPGDWKKVIHDRKSEWLASWIDVVTGKRKYVWLAAHSKFRAEADLKKFDLARKLKRGIGKIRQTIEDELTHGEDAIRQVATALYLIDNFALRVGNEKGADAADTVGVTSLRVEHIIFEGNNTITLDFLGKDSIRYNNTHTVSSQVYKNLRDFTKGKDKDDDLFDKIDSSFINKYLQSFMKNLTAKVFRTYNASNLFQKELNKISKKIHPGNEETQENNINEILDMFNKANMKVALLCNHQKKVSKSFNSQIDTINEKIKTLQRKVTTIRRKQAKRTKKSKRDADRINRIKKQISDLKTKKKIKIELKSVSLETSKANYIDPRITIAFVKKHGLPIDKIFSKALQEKFKWAFDVSADWKF